MIPNGAHHGEGSPLATLKFVFDCLSSPKASQKVCECVVEMAVNLLTLGKGEGGRRRGDGKGGVEVETVDIKGVGKEGEGGKDGRRERVEAMEIGGVEEGESKREGKDGGKRIEAMDTGGAGMEGEGRGMEKVDAMDANDAGKEGEGKHGGKDGVEVMDAGGANRESTGGIASGEDLLSPFIPCLLAYLNRVIGENVGKGGKVRDGRRSLENEFVLLSR